MTDTERLLGDHGARIERLEEDFHKIDDRLREIGLCLARIDRTLNQAKGGWKTLTTLGIFASALISAVLAWWLRGFS